MKSFARLYLHAAARKGGETALEESIGKPKSVAALAFTCHPIMDIA